MARTEPSAKRKFAACRLEKSSSSAWGELGGVPLSPGISEGPSSVPIIDPTHVALELRRPRSPTASVLLRPSVTWATRIQAVTVEKPITEAGAILEFAAAEKSRIVGVGEHTGESSGVNVPLRPSDGQRNRLRLCMRTVSFAGWLTSRSNRTAP